MKFRSETKTLTYEFFLIKIRIFKVAQQYLLNIALLLKTYFLRFFFATNKSKNFYFQKLYIGALQLYI